MVVVTRYYGGKKLGVRGLIDAYHSTALQTLRAAGRRPFRPTVTLNLALPYPQLPVVNHLLQTYEGKIVKEEYGVAVRLTVRLPENNQAALTGALQGLPEVNWEVGTDANP